MFSIGLLSWKARQTLRKTLDSYREAKLAACADEFKVFFNEISDEDRKLAAEYGLEAVGSECNLGIWGGMDACANALSGEVILLLQNDCPVVSDPEETARILREGVELIRSGKADLVRLRHRFNQGEGISYRRFFDYHYVRELDPRALAYGDVGVPTDATEDSLLRRMRRLFRPLSARKRLVSAVHLERSPEVVYPQYVKREGEFLIVDSALAQFSEQSLLISKALYLRLSDWCRAHPRSRRINGAPVMEHALRSGYWYNGRFKVGFCDTGVFTHNRYDDSWRPNHASFNAAISEVRA